METAMHTLTARSRWCLTDKPVASTSVGTHWRYFGEPQLLPDAVSRRQAAVLIRRTLLRTLK